MDGNVSVDPIHDNDEMNESVEVLLQQTQTRFQTMFDSIFKKIEDMRRRMDGVEKSVYDLRAELGGENAPPVRADAKYDFEPPKYI